MIGLTPDTRGGVDVVYCEPCTILTTPPFPPLPAVQYHAVHLLKGGDADPAWPPASRVLPGVSAFACRTLDDGRGGLFMGWMDARTFATSNYDVYVHHLRADGSLDPAWPASGRAVCAAAGRQFTPLMVLDGTGGVLLAWSDRRDSATTGTDLYAAHVKANGTLDPSWPADGRAVLTLPANQIPTGAIADGAGGLLVVEQDSRNNATNLSDAYAHHVRSDGTLDPAWPATGAPVLVGPGSALLPHAISDRSGGAFVSLDYNGIFHLLASGALDPGWPASGVAIASNPITFTGPRAVADGGGGVFAATTQIASSATNETVVLRHVFASGQYDPAWPVGGVVLGATGANEELVPQDLTEEGLVADGHGGVWVSYRVDADGTGARWEYRVAHVRNDGQFDTDWNGTGRTWNATPGEPVDFLMVSNGDGTSTIAWDDLRDSAATYLDVYAHRFTSDGHFGVAEPVIRDVRDVPGDQGGQVLVRFHSSAFDTLPADPVTEYDIWRRVDGPAARRALAEGARFAREGEAPRIGQIRQTSPASDVYWEFTGRAPARGTDNYALAVPTRGDSTIAGLAREVYEIDVHATALNFIATSDPDSGYSVDNLPPAAPAPFTASYTAGSGSLLNWGNSVEPDLAGYRLYRGATASFVPSPATRIYEGQSTSALDGGGPAYFKVSAYDRHGNEGPAASVLSGGTVAVEGGGIREVALRTTGANPAHDGARLALDLPAGMRARVWILDAQGREVRSLADGALTAGTHLLRWDGRDRAGRRALPGLYFARLEAGGVTRQVKLALL